MKKPTLPPAIDNLSNNQQTHAAKIKKKRNFTKKFNSLLESLKRAGTRVNNLRNPAKKALPIVAAASTGFITLVAPPLAPLAAAIIALQSKSTVHQFLFQQKKLKIRFRIRF